MKLIFSLIASIMLTFTGCGNPEVPKDNALEQPPSPMPPAQTEIADNLYAQIDIENYGSIVVELNKNVAPITVDNFVNLINDKFYDGLTFHRIIDGFMIQGGSLDGLGIVGSENTIKGEFASNGVENNISHTRGTISMARTMQSNDSASSQFFIVQQDSTFLDKNYAGFGHVVSGMDVVDNIAKNTPVIDNNGTVPKENQPKITSIKMIEWQS